MKLKLPVALGSRVCKLKIGLTNYLRLEDYYASWLLHLFSDHLTCTFVVHERDESLILPLPYLKNVYLMVIKLSVYLK